MSNISIPGLVLTYTTEREPLGRYVADAHNLPETDRSIRRCPRCQSVAIRRIGLTSSGTQRYKCNNCSKSFTGTKVGRPCLGDRPLTNYESVKRSRLKSKQNLTKVDPIDRLNPPD